MDLKQISNVRRAVSRAKNAGCRVRYSDFVRRSALEWLRAGQGPAEIAERTGIGLQTLMRWSGSAVGDDSRRLDPATTAKTPATGEISVEFANGARLMCPSVDLLVKMLEFFR
jgi:hypothetical protein